MAKASSNPEVDVPRQRTRTSGDVPPEGTCEDKT
jgi:hypothetical protein